MDALLLKSAEAAALLSVSAKLLERWRGEGKGPEYIRLGYNMVRYKRSDLEKWLDDKEYLN